MSRPPCTFRRLLPALAAALCGLSTVGVMAATPRVAVGSDFVLVSRADGTVWAWGLGSDGQLGNGCACPAAFRSPSAG
jgi:hypothetical protein